MKRKWLQFVLPVFSCLFLLQAVPFSGLATGRASQLPYSEGGPSVVDPGASLAPSLRRYVDRINGSDSNDGQSPQNAWKTIGKVVSEKHRFAAGTHILLRRGQSWMGGFDFSDVHGSEGKRMVLGAFGDLAANKPRIRGTVSGNRSSYLMVRDLDCIKLDASGGAHHIVIFNNVVHGDPGLNEYPSNGIRVFGPSHHIAIVANLVYDLRANDCIAIHPDGQHNSSGSHHWVVDNVCIGDNEMEDEIDLAMGDDNDPNPSIDVKVVENFLQAKALPGLSAKTGRGQKCFSAGHKGKFYWVIGNTMGGSWHIGVNPGSSKDHLQFSGNVIFNCANNNAKVSCEFKVPNSTISHNTIIHMQVNRSPAKLSGANKRFIYNLLLRTHAPGNWLEGLPSPPGSQIVKMDYNWYGYSATPAISGMSLQDWRSTTGFDLHSHAGDVPGVTAPQENPFNDDPRNWHKPEFLSHFFPDENWSGNKDEDTPGAFDKDGKRIGTEFKPFAELEENNGYGWEGPLIVQERYPLPVNTKVNQRQSLKPEKFGLRQNYPNPFNQATRISFFLPLKSSVHLAIYSITGRLVRTLEKDQKAPGEYSLNWYGRNMNGNPVTTGVYLYRLRIIPDEHFYNGRIVESKKMLVLR